MTEGTFPKVNGDILYASEANLLNGTMQVYTSTAINASAAGNTVENSYELTALTATQIKSAKYVKIIAVLSTATAGNNYDGDGELYFKVQTKQTGGSYSDSLAYVIINNISQNYPHNNITGGMVNTIVHYHLLTAGELSNGVQVKLFGKASAASGMTASLTNIQIIEEIG